MLLDKRSESIGISALEGIDDALVLEEEEGGHSANAVSLRNRLNTVNVDLEEDDAGVLRCKSLEHGRDHLAWTTP